MKIYNDELEEGGNAENIVYVFLTEMDCLMNEMFIILRVFSQSSMSSLQPPYMYLKQFCIVFKAVWRY